MKHTLSSPYFVKAVLTLVIAAPVAWSQKAAAAPARPYVAPKTAWGAPDIQGVYTFATHTPLQRPEALADKTHYTAEELKAQEDKAKEKYSENIATNEHFSYNALWFVGDEGKPTGQTSLIIDPPNGRFPPLTEHGENLRKANVARLAAKRIGKDEITNTWADHSSYNRCISRPFPRINQEYNQGVQILQTPDSVVIFYESMHDTRIVPLDGSPHINSSLRQWNGDSRGHWEGNTLVIDSTNFSEKQRMDDSTPFGGFMQGNISFTERLTRADANTVIYEVTVKDPEIWTKPFTFRVPWRAGESHKGPEDLYEFACHEGNYRMIEDTITGTKVLLENKAKEAAGK